MPFRLRDGCLATKDVDHDLAEPVPQRENSSPPETTEQQTQDSGAWMHLDDLVIFSETCVFCNVWECCKPKVLLV